MASETIYRTDQYYQAIIQIRPKDKEILAYVRKQVKKKGSEISKEVFYKYGVDVYVTDQKVARNIGQRLKRAFKGELKITKKIFSRDRQTSRDIYRGTVLFRRIKEEENS
ncbi:MAG: NMD3-related protein [Nanoarchaeota archaeon]|nr:NMD3-related protein [Nanoarchaeota archaeon]